MFSFRLFWTSSSFGCTSQRSHKISHPPSFYDACLHFSRGGFNRSFPSSTVKSKFMYDSQASACACVLCFSPKLFWTSSSLDVPAGITQEEGHTGFLTHLPSAVRALIFFFSREVFSHSLSSATVKSNFVQSAPRPSEHPPQSNIYVLFYFYFFKEKSDHT